MIRSKTQGRGARLALTACLTIAAALTGAVRADEPFDVEVTVDPSTTVGKLRPIWRFFGADEPNYVYMKDGQHLLDELGGMKPDHVFFRAHNLLTTGDGTPALKWGSTNAYTEDADGNPVYNWTIVDYMFESMLERGVKPYVQLGFMPKALSRKPEPYRHEWRPGLPYDRIMTGWRFPPNDWGKWEELIYQLALHCKEKYGEEEASSWYWETWNEANIHPHGYWGGTREEFFKLHDHTIAAVRRALPNAIVGGPDVAGDGGDFTRAFFEHCLHGKNLATGETGTPTDFVSFHAKGAPRWQGDHIRMGISAQLRTIDRGFGIVASFPELKETPIVIGESDPEGCAACQGDMFSYRNGSVYSSYTAASFARKHELADKHGVFLQGALTWAFTFEDQAYFAGFRQLASNGIPLPVLNVLRMMSRMQGDRVESDSSGQYDLDKIVRDGVREKPDVGCLASGDGEHLWLMLWHYHDDDIAGPDAEITIKLADSTKKYRVVSEHRVDEHHSNSYAEWQRMGSPFAPNSDQYDQLMKSSSLKEASDPIEQVDGGWSLTLPRKGVALVELVAE